MRLFYTESNIGDIHQLTSEESKHCIKVLRMGMGQELWLTDGRGTMCRCEIINPDHRACEVSVIERIENHQKRNHHLHIAIAATKNSARIEWFLEKAVEIGIDEITPIICDHSERDTIKTDRLEKIIVSAMKQSLKAYKPKLNDPTPIIKFIQNTREGIKAICHCEETKKTSLKDIYHPNEPITILIGPEGDFSTREIQCALDCQYLPVSLGDCRLRTETAALYAVTAINFINS